VFDVINDGDLEATVHWRGLRLERSYSVPQTATICAGHEALRRS
jgi:hypothetical protein